jgi:hypothetical protein
VCAFGSGSIVRSAIRFGSDLSGSASTGTARLTGEKVSEVLARGVRSGAEYAIAIPPSRQITCSPTLSAIPGMRACAGA